ncbi:hypothetical protein ACFL3R_01375 [Thermodesulfobacteriota bacterium]
MANITVHAGDFTRGKGSFFLGTFTFFDGETAEAMDIERIDIATEENVKKLGGTVGWGVAGGVLFGPVGLLAGLLLGGRKKEVTLIVVFEDGLKFIATTDSKTYKRILESTF